MSVKTGTCIAIIDSTYRISFLEVTLLVFGTFLTFPFRPHHSMHFLSRAACVGLALSFLLAVARATQAPSYAPSQAPTMAPTTIMDEGVIHFSKEHSDAFILIACCLIVVYVGFGLFFRWLRSMDEKDAKILREQALNKTSVSANAPGNPLHRARSGSGSGSKRPAAGGS